MDEIKPVAWRSKDYSPLLEGQFAWAFTANDNDLRPDHEPLYDQQAIDTLRAEVEENDGVIRVWRGRAERAEAEVESAWTQANRAAAKVRAWESTMVFRGLPRSIHPIDDWGPGADGYVEIPALTPERLTSILDRLAAAEAEAEALRKDAERYRWLRLALLGAEDDPIDHLLLEKEPETDAEFDAAVDAAIDAAKQAQP